MADTVLGKVSLVPRGEYAPSETYEFLDYVRYQGSGFIVRKQCTGITPEEGEYYMLAVAKGDTGAKGDKGDTGDKGSKGDPGEKGDQGSVGPQGPQGPVGPEGPRGIDGTVVETSGQWAFGVDENGHLYVYYVGNDEPDLEIGEDGHLYLNLD